MKKILAFLILFYIFALPVSAEDAAYSVTYESIGGAGLDDSLDLETQDFLRDNGIDPADYTWVNNLTDKNVLVHIFEFVTGGIKVPLRIGVTMIGVILITSALTSFSASSNFETAIYGATLAICAVIAGSIWQSISACVNAIKGCSTFMFGFVPVFASATALSGKSATAVSMSALLLGATEVVSFISSFTVLPLMGGYMALSVTSGVSPLLDNSGLVESVKKVSLWILSLIGTLFVGVLGIQTAVNSAADSVSQRTAKFFLGTVVPVAGNFLSDAVSTISASMGLLRSSVGIYGIVALAAVILPVLIENIMWRIVMMVTSSLSTMFGLHQITRILKAVDGMFSVLLGILLLVGGLFIIALTVVVMAGKG